MKLYVLPFSLLLMSPPCLGFGSISGLLQASFSDNTQRGDTLIKPSNHNLAGQFERISNASITPVFFAAKDNISFQLRGWLDYSHRKSSQSDLSHSNFEWTWSDSYLQWDYSNAFNVSIGLSNIEQGPGYAWNPGNPFFDIRLNERDTAFEFRRDADPTLRVNIYDDLGRWLFLTTEYRSFPLETSDADPKQLSVMAARELLFNRSQWAFRVASVDESAFAAGTFESTVGDQLELHAEISIRQDRKIPFFSSLDLPAGNISQYDDGRDNNSYINFLVGFQFTWQNNANLIVEYFYQEDGYSKAEWNELQLQLLQQYEQSLRDTLPDELHSASIGFLSNTHNWLRLLRQKYGFIRLSMPELLGSEEISFFARTNFQDNSYVSGFNLAYPLSDSLTLQFSTQIAHGDKQTEGYWIPTKRQVTASLKLHF